MAKTYTHLTRGERERIRLLRLEKRSIGFIAAALFRSKSTIQREVKRHLHHNGYEPERADGHARKVRTKARRPRKMMVPEIAAYVKEGLLKNWSPEQIAGRVRLQYPRSSRMHISHQCIYDWLYRDKKSGGAWYKLLRKGRRKRRRVTAWQRGPIRLSERKGIEQRPASVDSRRFYGDWEADTVEGRHGRGRLATCVERKTLFTVIAKMASRHASCFNSALLGRLCQNEWLPLRTLTADNGPEFARHVELSKTTGMPVYFAQPGCSWQRGLNENTNGLLRQYFPKKTDFLKISDEKIADVEQLLNNRPRKKLGYRTPNEIMARRFKPAFVPLVI